ncbi:hypothetical protein NE686_17920 [Tissierella carlieri]|uniref:Uncharacterized protein n=1 Tax=Tissierella carlieri TaxID=689904 RepID=A0ABT1SES0_9FIRM|nr:hypothetical protein [Tissierella carlieri]MCQ4924983.1 hypothetical protein [Tissierella carlieri]
MKARNRKERIEFLIKKIGLPATQSLLTVSDREVKKYYETVYPIIKDRTDYEYNLSTPCIRCGSDVVWKSECGCGENRAVFDNEGWLDDIENNDVRLPGDEEFLKTIRGIDECVRRY